MHTNDVDALDQALATRPSGRAKVAQGFKREPLAQALVPRDRFMDALQVLREAAALTPEDEELFNCLSEIAALQPQRRSRLPFSGALKPAYDEVVLLCPEVVTGGPEALHQLAHAINTMGGNAKLAYYGGGSRVELAGNVLRCHYTPNPALQEAFGAYHPVPLTEAILGPRSLVILPEVCTDFGRMLAPYPRAMWWLSVDNALASNPLLKDALHAKQILSESATIHFAQSDYARNFLDQNGVRHIHSLYDYINRDYLASGEIATGGPRQGLIGLFPRKGGELASRFIQINPELPYALIQDMTRDQVRNTLEQCAVYIDFGDHPGKDRVPREAAASGAIVFLHERGAATRYADHPLDKFYVFTSADIESGDLRARVKAAIADRDEHLRRQRIYRQRIVMETAEFELQVATAFFEGS